MIGFGGMKVRVLLFQNCFYNVCGGVECVVVVCLDWLYFQCYVCYCYYLYCVFGWQVWVIYYLECVVDFGVVFVGDDWLVQQYYLFYQLFGMLV